MSALRKSLKVTVVLLGTVSSASLAMAGNQAHYPSYTPDLVPPNANAGKCYARVEIPAQYSTSTERVMIEDGYSKAQGTQVQLTTTQERIMVKEPSVRFDVRQPSFRTVSEKVMVSPSYDKLHFTKPEFDIVTETLRSGPPTLVWKRGNPGKLMAKGYKIHSTADGGTDGAGYSSLADYSRRGATSQVDRCGDTCEIWCLVEEPGSAVSYNRRVLKSPASVRRESVPAKFKTIMKQIVSDPGGVREIPVPGEYKMMSVQKVGHPSDIREVNVPPKFGTVAKKNLVTPSRYEWRQVVCKPGTGSIRSSASYTQPVTPAVVTPIPSPAPTYSGSGYSGTPYTGGSSHIVQTYEASQACTNALGRQSPTCVNPGIHARYDGRSRTYGGPTPYSSHLNSSQTYSGSAPTTHHQGYINNAYDLPAISSDNLGHGSKPTGAKRRRW